MSRAERPSRSFVSAQDVARRAGVSRSAVSRTFTDGASVSPDTRRKVLEAADALGYHVNHLARGLIQDASNIVSLVVTDVATPYQSELLDALTRRLQVAGKVSMVINTSGEAERVEAALRQTLHYRADATVVLSGQPAASLIATCLASGQHVILLNRDHPEPGPEIIEVTSRRAAAEAFHMLHRAGCRRMLVVASDVGSPSIQGRKEAFVAAANEAGVPVEVRRFGPSVHQSGAEIARRVLSGLERPDGAFCVTDLLACGFMDVARHEFGMRIPEELCVVGFDDIEQASWPSYALTTFRQPIEDIANHIVSRLERRPSNEFEQGTKTFYVEPVWRRTVRPRGSD